MAGYVVVGTQWGDEGKGKIIDVLADNLYHRTRCCCGSKSFIG